MPEHTIAENLTRLFNAKTAIGNAITAKGGTVDANDGLEEFATDIGTIPSGGGGSSADAVKFYDYDGTIVHSYSASEFANLTELPSNSIHEGLTSQGWNWTLAAAKTYVANYGELNIGQMYNTSDGKTRIHITLHDGRLEPYLGLGINGSVDVDWGDGSAHDTMSGSSLSTPVLQSHKYAAEGDYVIALAVTGKIAFLYDNTKGALLLTDDKSPANFNTGYRNAIHKVNIGNNVMSIGDDAFYFYQSLTFITIPNGVTSIGTGAFTHCSSLSSITIPSSVTSIGQQAFYGCSSLTSITIPSRVASIGASAFTNCYSLTSITIPSSVASIGTSVFTNCSSLTSITIPNGVTSIGQQAFQGCSSLTSITIPSGVASIGTYVFSGCSSLTSITIPSSVASIGTGAFQGCSSLTSITIPSSVASIGTSAFTHCSSLTSITIPNGVASIGASAFTNCSSLTSITIPSSVASIGTSAFQGCSSLTSITIPSSVASIGTSVFSGCYSLSSITIPSSVTSIGQQAFYACSSLTSITIPSSVTSIGQQAFSGGYGLGYIKFLGITTIPTIANTNAWTYVPTDCYILVPFDYLDDYINTTNMPDDSTYLYLCYATYADGATLPTVDSDGYTLTWYATREDAKSETNPITVGNGKEIYARGVEP